MLVASTEDGTKLLTFDFRAQKWNDLAAIGTLGASELSPDSKYSYYTTLGASESYAHPVPRTHGRDDREPEGSQQSCRLGLNS